jgi:hypothetical protein
MDKRKLTKLILQGAAIIFGLIGLVEIYMGVEFAITGIRDSDLFELFIMAPMFFLMGGLLLAVAWQNLRHFGPNSIRNVTFLLVFALYLFVPDIKLYQEATARLKTDLLQFAAFLIPVLLGFVLYSVVSKKLIQITKIENSEQANSTGPADAVR